MRWMLILSALALSACANQWEPTAGEGRMINLRIVSDAEMMREFLDAGGSLRRGTTLRGFAVIGGPICKVWVTPQTVQTQTLNHEIRHCFEGRFHE